jgi:DNA-binding CsgD family transcriptional regulator
MPIEVLSRREAEVMKHLIIGQLNKQIAADLGITEGTVKQHRASILSKLNCSSVVDLVRIANDIGMEFMCDPDHQLDVKIQANFIIILRLLRCLTDHTEIPGKRDLRKAITLTLKARDEYKRTRSNI